MKRRYNISGKRFGRLTAIKTVGKEKCGQMLWLCKCECRNTRIIPTGDLMAGRSKSCGCLKNDMTRERLTTHGQTRSVEHTTWLSMRQRCQNKKHPSFKNYGGRGISVCKRWDKFENFLKDMGKRPKGLEIERKNNNGNYEPSNCKWATRKEQTRNMRKSCLITFRGQTKCFSAWVEDLKLNYERVRGRMRLGWSFMEAIK